MGSSDQQQAYKNPAPAPETGVIRRALISVSDKAGIDTLASRLHAQGVEILSTGGTAKALEESGVPVQDVSGHTGFPEIMDGRVKTLHPLIHGGILARRDKDDHRRAMTENGIAGIDLLAVNLYPFVRTVAEGGTPEECIENIDIGGPCLIRAAAKNHEFVTVLTDPADYDDVLEEMARYNGATSPGLRRRLAAKAFALTAAYEARIAAWFAEQEGEEAFPKTLGLIAELKQELRYGENPHQSAALYLDDTNRPGVATASQVQGKELSYNNLNDTDAAFELVAEFEEPAVAIIKHANPCGVATGANTLEAYRKALLCDPVSAFGGIIALNRMLDTETAGEILQIFSEVIIAPSVEHSALPVLQKKHNIRVLTTGDMPDPATRRHVMKSIAGGYLMQDADSGQAGKDELQVVTDREPTEKEWADMLFAWKVAKHVKSNAIVYAKDGATVGIGAGQMSRIDSARIAAQKAADAASHAGLSEPLTKGSAAASDAFFPFPDGLLTVADAGATAIIQPGGSIRDEDVIAAANERGLAMVFTGMRHFRH